MRVRDLARLLTGLDNRRFEAIEALAAMELPKRKANVTGLTGPPGSGKSTIADRLITAWRQQDLRVAVLAVDPTSPFSGGAILGDRIRMSAHSSDPGVFIRSMATRGHLGGTSAAAPDFIRAMEVADYDVILVETVGVGQSEVEIASMTDTVILTTVPGLGDDMQAMKAGIMEIGDIILVNKSDRPGAEVTVAQLRAAIDMSAPQPDHLTKAGWHVPVLMCCAENGDGMDTLVQTLDHHRNHLVSSGILSQRRLSRMSSHISTLIHEYVQRYTDSRISDHKFEQACRDVETGAAGPLQVIRSLLEGTELEKIVNTFPE